MRTRHPPQGCRPDHEWVADCFRREAAAGGQIVGAADGNQPVFAAPRTRNDYLPGGPRQCKWGGCSETRSTPNTLSSHQRVCPSRQPGMHTPQAHLVVYYVVYRRSFSFLIGPAAAEQQAQLTLQYEPAGGIVLRFGATTSFEDYTCGKPRPQSASRQWLVCATTLLPSLWLPLRNRGSPFALHLQAGSGWMESRCLYWWLVGPSSHQRLAAI